MDKNILEPAEVEALLKNLEHKSEPDQAELEENLLLQIELGQLEISVRKFMSLKKGDELNLNSKVSNPLNVLINGRVVAKGQLKIAGRSFSLNLTEIIHKYG